MVVLVVIFRLAAFSADLSIPWDDFVDCGAETMSDQTKNGLTVGPASEVVAAVTTSRDV